MKKHIVQERAKYQTGFASIFDFENEVGPLIKSADDVALVDVGGSLGHVLEDVRRYVPGLKGRLVLEDLEETVKRGEVGDGIEVLPYDFLESVQPIKGIFYPNKRGNSADCLTKELHAIYSGRYS